MKLKRTFAAAAALMLTMGIASLPALAQHGRYGGSIYAGKPQLNVTASVIKAGGGAAHFSTNKLLPALAGQNLAKAEVAKLTKQYGKAKIATFIKVNDFAIRDAVNIATKAGIKLPAANLSGKSLAATLVKQGLEKDGTFNVELTFDKLLSHHIHNRVMDDIDKKFGGSADADYHKILNQMFYDLAHALGLKNVKLNRFH